MFNVVQPPSQSLEDSPTARRVRLNGAIFLRMIKESRSRLPQGIRLVCILAIASFIGLIPPLIFRLIVDQAIRHGRVGDIILLGVSAFAVYLAAQSLSAWGNFLAAKYASGVILDLRSAMFRKLVDMPHAFYLQARAGMVISRFLNDPLAVQQLLSAALGNVLGIVTTFGLTMIFMAILSWKVTLVVLLVLPAALLPSHFLARHVRESARRQLHALGDMTSFLDERLDVAGSLVIKTFSDSHRETSNFVKTAATVRANAVRLSLFVQFLVLSTGLIAIATLVTTYTYGSVEVARRAISVGTMIALATYIMRATAPILSLSGTRSSLLQAQLSLERIFEVIDVEQVYTRVLPSRPNSPSRAACFSGHLRFDNVTFRYPFTNPFKLSLFPTESVSERGPVFALAGVTFTAYAGRLTAIVGASGAGKSTVCALIAGLYQPTEGTIQVANADFADLEDSLIRKNVGLINQDAYFFHDSVANNLRIAKPEATEEDLEAACRLAMIHQIIEKLPAGYATPIGERGFRLSGGEKQRLAIARLLLKDPAIVVLDEATAHLDSVSEALVQAALATLLDGRTVITIAHRLSTVVTSDQIIVLSAGRIVQQGKHAELISQPGEYADLFRTQILPV